MNLGHVLAFQAILWGYQYQLPVLVSIFLSFLGIGKLFGRRSEPFKKNSLIGGSYQLKIEKSIRSRRYSYLINHKLLFKKQFGFGKNHSTSHALISRIDLIKKYLDNE